MRIPALLCMMALLAGPLAASPLTHAFPPDCGQGYRKGEVCTPMNLGLTTAGDSLTATWNWKAPGLLDVDTGYVTWSVKRSPLAPATAWSAWTALLPVTKTRGTTDARVIALPNAAGSADSIRVCVVQHRGTPVGDSPPACAVKGRAGPPAGADNVQLSAVIVLPGAVTLTAGGSVLLCKVARWANDSLTATLPWPAACDPVLAAARAG